MKFEINLSRSIEKVLCCRILLMYVIKQLIIHLFFSEFAQKIQQALGKFFRWDFQKCCIKIFWMQFCSIPELLKFHKHFMEFLIQCTL